MIKVLLLITGGQSAPYSATEFPRGYSVRCYTPSFGILSVNVIGSFLIGFCWSIAETCNLSAGARVFLFTGLFGGFTTFSSFALDTMSLMKQANISWHF